MGRLPFVAIASIFDHLSLLEKLPLVATSKAMQKLRKEPAFWRVLDLGVYKVPSSDADENDFQRRRDGTTRDYVVDTSKGISHASVPKIIKQAPSGSIKSLSFRGGYNGGILVSRSPWTTALTG